MQFNQDIFEEDDCKENSTSEISLSNENINLDDKSKEIIEDDIKEVANKSTETIYAIRTHFAALQEYLMILINSLVSNDLECFKIILKTVPSQLDLKHLR